VFDPRDERQSKTEKLKKFAPIPKKKGREDCPKIQKPARTEKPNSEKEGKCITSPGPPPKDFDGGERRPLRGL